MKNIFTDSERGRRMEQNWGKGEAGRVRTRYAWQKDQGQTTVQEEEEDDKTGVVV